MQPASEPSINLAMVAFAVTWIALGLLSLVGYLVLSPATKQRWYPRLVVLTGVLFPLFVFAIFAADGAWGNGLKMVAVAAPASALISYLNLRINRICPHCGRLTQTYGRLWPAHFCPRCGRPLAHKPAPAGGDVLD